MSGVIFSIFVGYILGSIPFGLLLAKAAGLGDIRKIGSGNIGATNVLRAGNKAIAAATLACDLLKGLAPVLIAPLLSTDAHAPQYAGLAAFFGHVFPAWLGFKGGKGIATAAGVLLGWSWPVALISLATWIFMFWRYRISSLAALNCAVLALPATYYTVPQLLLPVAILVAAIFITHRANIQRLFKGEEPKSSFSKPK